MYVYNICDHYRPTLELLQPMQPFFSISDNVVKLNPVRPTSEQYHFKVSAFFGHEL